MALENYSTYSEVDEDTDITVASNTLTIDTMKRDALSYVTRTHTVSGDFEHLLDFTMTAADDGGGGLCLWAISNGSDTLNQSDVNNEGIIVFIYRNGAWLNLNQKQFSNDAGDIYGGCVLNTRYYLTIGRTGTTGTTKIYTDSGRTSLSDTLTNTWATTAMSELYAMQSFERSTSPTLTMSGTINNLDLQEAGGGWANIGKVHGVTATDLAKVNGVAVAAIGKFNGTAV